MICFVLSALISVSSPTLYVKVDGEGFLRFARDGRSVFAKEARLTIMDGKITTASRVPVLPTIFVSAKPNSLIVDERGVVTGVFGQARVKLGQLVLGRFTSSEPMPSDGFLISSERALLGKPGDESFGLIRVDSKTLDGAQSSTPKETVSRPVAEARPIVTSQERGADDEKRHQQFAGTVKISINQESLVAKGSFTLGEVAEIFADPKITRQLSSVVLGESPAVGAKRGIDMTRIVSRLKAAQFKPESFTILVPQGACVLQKFQTIPASEFIDKATREAIAQFGLCGTLEPSDAGPGDMRVPIGDVRLDAGDASEQGMKVEVTVRVFIDGTLYRSRKVQLARSGMPAPPKVGDLVKIRVRSSGVAIETNGKVTQSGRPGQPIRVKTLDGTEFVGTLTGEKMVEVKL